MRRYGSLHYQILQAIFHIGLIKKITYNAVFPIHLLNQSMQRVSHQCPIESTATYYLCPDTRRPLIVVHMYIVYFCNWHAEQNVVLSTDKFFLFKNVPIQTIPKLRLSLCSNRKSCYKMISTKTKIDIFAVHNVDYRPVIHHVVQGEQYLFFKIHQKYSNPPPFCNALLDFIVNHYAI